VLSNYANRRLVAVSICAFVASIGCSKRLVPPVELVPTDAIAVLVLDWKAVERSPELSAAAPVIQVRDRLAEFLVPSSLVTQVVLFSDAAAVESAGVLVLGSFGAPEVVEQLSSRGWRRAVDPVRAGVTDPKGMESVTAVGRRTLAFGPPIGVGHVEAVAAGKRKALLNVSSAVTDVFTTLPTELPIRAAVVIPTAVGDAVEVGLELSESVLGLTLFAPAAGVLRRIGTADAVGYGLDLTDSVYSVQLVAAMRNEQSAATIAGGLALLNGVAGLVPDDARASRSSGGILLTSLSVGRQGRTLAVHFQVPISTAGWKVQ
jgi:hypothetical protein